MSKELFKVYTTFLRTIQNEVQARKAFLFYLIQEDELEAQREAFG